MKNLKTKLETIRHSDGFTIIEVMIVLAIAGVIMLIVLLTVPALQRSSRNTQRKHDVAAMLTGVSNYIANHNSTLPGDGTFAASFPDTATLGYYVAPAVPAANLDWNNNATAAAVTDPASVDKVKVANYSVCDTTTNVGTATGASARSVVAVYDIETSGGTPQPQCQQL